ncbi:MAG: 23S rRNA (uridine(2552)-2'-O)-methyltransferase RlmE [Gammaproteobacteria bacterium]|nr:23S rRNA (uridine(2552)-2'-O)-methyltransferase RlmE [Gammaproteobacteria bacterium]MCP5137818.1 23S rRNA (uridine(2552)-2'-O)-methyltransferase RlmE [Gammaproteobacteria bacterium]
MARSKSSSRWLQEHFNDEFVLEAQKAGWRSRAVYKLEEIQKRDKLIRQGMTVIDLGAAPGAWSQYVVREVGHRGRVIALDILPMDTLADVEIITGDFREDETLQTLRETLGDAPVDLVLSDMAPNMSGVEAVDQPRSMYLAELALELAREVLKPGGDLLVKVFQGAGFEALRRDMQAVFGSLASRKPKASRPRSREVYLLARNFKP